MTAKPICVIYFPDNYSIGKGGKLINVMELMSVFNGWDNHFYKRDGFDEYIWFCFLKEGIREPEFKVFYEKDFTEIQYQELKELVLGSLNK